MKTSEYGINLIKHFEGCVLTAYKCPAGVWTIGYGHTKDVQPGDEWSESHANHMLEVELEEYENYVNTAVKVPLQQNQFDALVSWTYNLGGGNLNASTIKSLFLKSHVFQKLVSMIVFGTCLAVHLDSPCLSASVAPFFIPKDVLGGTDVISQTPG